MVAGPPAGVVWGRERCDGLPVGVTEALAQDVGHVMLLWRPGYTRLTLGGVRTRFGFSRLGGGGAGTPWNWVRSSGDGPPPYVRARRVVFFAGG